MIIDEILRAITGTGSTMAELRQTIDELEAERDMLQRENNDLQTRNNSLQEECASLRTQNFNLKNRQKKEVCALKEQIEELEHKNQALHKWDTELMQKIEEAKESGEFRIFENVEHERDVGLETLATILKTWQAKGEINVAEESDSPQNKLAEKTADFLREATIEDLELDVRTFNALKRAGLSAVADIISCPMSKIMQKRNFGKHSANILARQLMLTYGLKVADESTPQEQKKIDQMLLPARMELMNVEDMGLSIDVLSAIARWNEGKSEWDATRISSVSCLYYYYTKGELLQVMEEKQVNEVAEKLKESGFLP